MRGFRTNPHFYRVIFKAHSPSAGLSLGTTPTVTGTCNTITRHHFLKKKKKKKAICPKTSTFTHLPDAKWYLRPEDTKN